MLGLFPVLGFTTWLIPIIALRLRLNIGDAGTELSGLAVADFAYHPFPTVWGMALGNAAFSAHFGKNAGGI
ncbi:MAG: hypothetical protein R2788_04145 [Saprospiraceae bacterium]